MNLIESAVDRLVEKRHSPVPDPRPVASNPPSDYPHSMAAPDLDKTAPRSFRARHEPSGRTRPPLRFGPAIELPLGRLKDKGFLIPASRATATGHEFRLIKGPILEKAFGGETQRVSNGKLLVVTSAMPGEGKTFCAINLAMSIAATGDYSVLLVDADVEKPSIARHLGIDSPSGLIDILNDDDLDPIAAILPTNIDGLSVLPGGTPRAHAGESLAGQALAALLDRLCADLPDRLIIIDTPPLLAVTETRSLLQRAGQVILVVAAGETPQRSVEAALAIIQNPENVNVILNKVSASQARLDYYYGY